MENKQEEEKMKSVSSGNVILEAEIEELTANDQESKQHEVSEIKRPGSNYESEDPNNDGGGEDDDNGNNDDNNNDAKRKRMEPRSEISHDLDMIRMRKNIIYLNRSFKEDELVTAEMYKEPDLYLAAKNGDLGHFKTIFDRISNGVSEDNILSRLSHIKNTFLHVAANHRNQDIVKFIASMKPSLVLAKNVHGETALHLAAKGGDKAMVEALVGILSHNETEKRDLLMAENEMGNTALHVALFCGWESIATYLIEQDSVPSYHLNKHGESAIYLAAKAGFVECVSSILAQCTDESHFNKLFENKSPIQAPRKGNKSPFQAAIERKEIVVLEAIINANPELIQMRDSEGRNPLHYAASLGQLKATQYLLQKDAFNASKRNKRGELPIYNVFHFVLKNPNLDSLINMKNKFGDTPLHIATSNDHAKIVSTLTWDQRVETKAVNNREMTALDVAYEKRDHNPSFTKRLTWAALKAASVPQNSYLSRMVNVDPNVYKDRVNTLLVVATLVATVTFAAGFTMPGGYISSETGTDLGMATMWRDTVFHVFVLCDTIAMYTSILVVTALIWAQLGDTTLVIYALELSAPLLGVALIMMSMAFTAGVTTVVTKLRWLQITVVAMSTSSIALLLLLLLPLCAPFTSRSRILRYLSYYPFCLLVLVTSTKPSTKPNH